MTFQFGFGDGGADKDACVIVFSEKTERLALPSK